MSLRAALLGLAATLAPRASAVSNPLVELEIASGKEQERHRNDIGYRDS